MSEYVTYGIFETLVRFTDPLNIYEGSGSPRFIRLIIDEIYEYCKSIEIYNDEIPLLCINPLNRSNITLITNVYLPTFITDEINTIVKIKIPSELVKEPSLIGRIFLIPLRNGRVVRGLAYKVEGEHVFVDVDLESIELLRKSRSVVKYAIPRISMECLAGGRVLGWPLSRIIGLVVLLFLVKMVARQSMNGVNGLIVLGNLKNRANFLDYILGSLIKQNVLVIFLLYVSQDLITKDAMQVPKEPFVFLNRSEWRDFNNISKEDAKRIVEALEIPFYSNVGYIFIPVKYVNTLYELIDLNSVVSTCSVVMSLRR